MGDHPFVVAVHGGIVTAILQLAAKTHFSTTLSAQNQPDILSMHIDFLRTCTHHPFTITITINDLKVGWRTSTIQLHLTQLSSKSMPTPGEPKIAATATSINFDASPGPPVPIDWKIQPQPKPAPDWAKLSKNQPDDNWLPAFIDGELMPYTRRMMQLSPRGGRSPVAGLCDVWNSFGSERIDSTHLAVLTDLIPSMSDSLLQTGGVFDARTIGNAVETWANANPGVPCRLSNSLAQAAKAGIWNSTLTLDIEFKERLAEEGLEWARVGFYESGG